MPFKLFLLSFKKYELFAFLIIAEHFFRNWQKLSKSTSNLDFFVFAQSCSLSWRRVFNSEVNQGLTQRKHHFFVSLFLIDSSCGLTVRNRCGLITLHIFFYSKPWPCCMQKQKSRNVLICSNFRSFLLSLKSFESSCQHLGIKQIIFKDAICLRTKCVHVEQ